MEILNTNYPGLDHSAALVTGAGRGIGRTIALHLAASGVAVAVNDIDPDSAHETANLVRETGAVSTCVPGDVSSGPDVEGIVKSALAELGHIDILVSNAGIVGSGSVFDLSPADWDRVFDVNVRGPFLLGREVAVHMRARRGGRIINVGSINGKIPRMHMLAYCTSKAALAHMSRGFALELAPYGITVNTVSPGSTGGAMAVEHFPNTHAEPLLVSGDQPSFRLGIPLGRLCPPEDVAALICFLGSALGRHITGQEIFVDGGQSMF